MVGLKRPSGDSVLDPTICDLGPSLGFYGIERYKLEFAWNITVQYFLVYSLESVGELVKVITGIRGETTALFLGLKKFLCPIFEKLQVSTPDAFSVNEFRFLEEKNFRNFFDHKGPPVCRNLILASF